MSAKAAAKAIRDHLDGPIPDWAIVLGSGLGALADAVEDPVVVEYAEIPGFPTTTVVGHSGRLVFGRLAGTHVLLQSGRFHLYEGHDPRTVVLPVRAFAELGIPRLIVTNAAGGIRRGFEPPLVMLIADHINLMWRNPLTGPVEEGELRFPDMSEPYSLELRARALAVAAELGIALPEGVYGAVPGPSYETPAEVRMLERLGADAVGMSTVPEVIAARSRGIEVLGLSTITNLAAGISPMPLVHDEVLEAGKAVAADLTRLVRGIVGK